VSFCLTTGSVGAGPGWITTDGTTAPLVAVPLTLLPDKTEVTASDSLTGC
jgi:hypothetical protein